MSRPADFEKSRKKKVRRRALGRFLLVALVTGLAFITYTYRYEITSQGIGVLLSDRIAMMTQSSRFPAALPDEPVELLTVGSRPAVVTKSSVGVYSPVGKEKFSEHVTGESTLAQSAGNYLLTYARGGHSLSVRSGETQLFSLRTDTAILAACIARNGSVAVVTAQEGSSFCAVVYANGYEKVFEYVAGDLSVTAAALSENGSLFAVGGVFSEDGTLASRVRSFSVKSGEELLGKEMEDEMLLSLQWRKDGALTAVSDRGAWTLLSQEGERKAAFDGQLAAFAVWPDGSVAAATGDYLTAHEVKISVYSAQMEQTASAVFSQEVRSLQPYGTAELLVFTGERVLRCTTALERQSVMETPGALQIAASGNSLYYTTVSQLCRMTLR